MGSSSSKSSSSTTYNNTDNRAVGDNGATVVTGSSHVTINSLAPEIADAAFEFASQADATNADGFEKLLGLAEGLFSQGGELIGQTQKAVVDAYAQAEADKAGTIDNRTIIVLGLAAAGVLAFRKVKK